MTDRKTLAFYSAEATSYAARTSSSVTQDLHEFLEYLHPGDRILELGCGSGSAAAMMLSRGFDVVPTDGCAEMASQAAVLLGKPVRVLLFEDLVEQSAYDAVWASACLLHVPACRLPEILRRVWCALRPGGFFYASYKTGRPAGRDRFDRYYNYPAESDLASCYVDAGDWNWVNIREQPGGGYDNEPTRWLAVTAQRALT